VRSGGWESLLQEYIREAHQSGIFAWGSKDCALWAADWVKSVTGSDFGAEWRGNYSTQQEAGAFMVSKGFTCTADIADAHLKKAPITFASRGDLLLHPQGCLGVCNGHYGHFLMVNGATRLETMRCARAWAVD
jgi:hypothetical protein